MKLFRLTALVAISIAVPGIASATQVRPCTDLAEEIAAGMRKKNTRFTLTVVRVGDEGERRVVGSCDGRTRRIVWEPRGTGEIVFESPAPAAAKPRPAAPAAPPNPAPVKPPIETSAPSASLAPPAPLAPAATLTVKHLDPASAPRQMSREQLESLRTLAVEQGADDRDTLEEFAQHLKVGALPYLSISESRTSDFVIVESAHTDPASAFTMITQNGKVILAERASWLIGLLPQQHSGYFDLCLLARDFPEPGASYSDWTVEFDGTRYVKKTREFKGRSCLDRVEVRIAR